MANKPIKKYSLGMISGAVFQSEFTDSNGEKKKSYSIKFQKSYKKKDGTWENTDFFYDSDIRTLYALIGSMLNNQVKVSVPTPAAAPQAAPASQPAQPTASPPPANDEVPF